jgi:YegS/Rv2252/BmrU family lipid kinase
LFEKVHCYIFVCLVEFRKVSNIPLIIVNPKSASGSTELRWAKTAADLATHFGAFKVEFTKYQNHATELAENAANAGVKFIIACGGDGTINEVANGILNSGQDTELGVLPSGTGGDFRRTLGMSSNSSECAKELQNGETKTIDVGKVTFQSHDNETVSRYFVNISSFGLSATIGEKVKEKNRFQWLPFDTIRGKAKFAFSTLETFLDIESLIIRVKVDGEEEKQLQTLNFCVANSRYFGGGMKIAPDAKIDDGFFDIINIGDIKTAKILLNAYKLYGGSHLELDEVKATTAKKIEVSAANGEEIHIETDGELPGKLPAAFEIVPMALKVRVPRAK